LLAGPSQRRHGRSVPPDRRYAPKDGPRKDDLKRVRDVHHPRDAESRRKAAKVGGSLTTREQKTMAFFQSPPELGNTYLGDEVLRRYLRNTMPPDALSRVEQELVDLGELSGGELHRDALA